MSISYVLYNALPKHVFSIESANRALYMARIYMLNASFKSSKFRFSQSLSATMSKRTQYDIDITFNFK